MTFCAALCWFQPDGNSGLATLIAQLPSRKAPTYIRVQCLCVCVCNCACLRVGVPPCCMTEPAHLSVCLLPGCLSLTGYAAVRRDPAALSDTHLVVCCLKNTGLKISPRALALSRFLEPFWHTLAKCLSRHWRVSQYCGGRLGVLAMRRSSGAHSSGFATSVETEMKREVSEVEN